MHSYLKYFLGGGGDDRRLERLLSKSFFGFDSSFSILDMSMNSVNSAMRCCQKAVGWHSNEVSSCYHPRMR